MLPCLLFPAVRFAWVFQPFLSGPCFLYELHSSVVPFPLWSALPPLSTMKRSDSLTPFRLSSFCWTVLPAWSGDIRGSQVPDVSLSPCHALWPRQAFRDLALRSMPTYALQRCAFDPFVLASAFLTSSPPVYAVTRLNCFRKVRTSLRPTEFLVYASSGSFDFVSLLPNHATLSMVGWLCLYLWGLSPHQKTSSFAWRTRKLLFFPYNYSKTEKWRRFQSFVQRCPVGKLRNTAIRKNRKE